MLSVVSIRTIISLTSRGEQYFGCFYTSDNIAQTHKFCALMRYSSHTNKTKRVHIEVFHKLSCISQAQKTTSYADSSTNTLDDVKSINQMPGTSFLGEISI